MTMRYVLSPCGTSVLTNQAGEGRRGLCNRYANAGSPAEVPAEERGEIEAVVAAAEG